MPKEIVENNQKQIIRQVLVQEEYEQLKLKYNQIKDLEPAHESSLQIERDLRRTYPRNPYFKRDTEGFLKLRRILRAYAAYESQVDYVQGMNFIVG